MPISCHFQDCKALLVTSLSHVSGTITSVDLYLFWIEQGRGLDCQRPKQECYDFPLGVIEDKVRPNSTRDKRYV